MMAVSEFGRAFRAARAAGKKDFSFGGKRYTTELAKPDTRPTVGGNKPGPQVGGSRPISADMQTPYQMSKAMRAGARAPRPAAKPPTTATAAELAAKAKTTRARADAMRNTASIKSLSDIPKVLTGRDPRAMAEREARTAERAAATATRASKAAAKPPKKPPYNPRIGNYAKGGSVRTRGDGIVSKGHTKGKCV